MKRRDLIKHLLLYGCHLVREGGGHSIWQNPTNQRRTAIPRNSEIPEYTA